ncbi:MAG: hypothetical protein ACYC9L_12085 [Sulfuricaulis sp.]
MLPQTYNHLNTQQHGAVCENLACAAFILKGFEVYRSEYDDRGIDMFVRSPRGTSYRVQVKGTRPSVQPFIYEKNFHLDDDFLFVAIRLHEGTEPGIYVARGSEWSKQNGCIRYNRDGGEHGPYYEFSFAKQYEAQRASYLFATYADRL